MPHAILQFGHARFEILVAIADPHCQYVPRCPATHGRRRGSILLQVDQSLDR